MPEPDAFEALFQYCCDHVTPEIIRAECPNDPGYYDYVKAWQSVWRSRRLPAVWDFDITETIGLTRWDEGIRPQLSRFRSFTGSITLWGATDDGSSPSDDSINYTLIRLVHDTLVCMDRRQAGLTVKACEEYRRLLPSLTLAEPEDEAWLLLTELLFFSFVGTPAQVEQRAAQVLETDERLRITCESYCSSHPETPVLGLCRYHDMLHGLWSDLTTWCLAPFVDEGEAVSRLLTGLAVWRDFQFTPVQMKGVPRQAVRKIQSMISAQPASLLPRRSRSLPELSGKLRRHFLKWDEI